MNIGGSAEPLPHYKEETILAIIWQNSKYKKRDNKLISTEAGRNTIAEIFKYLNDDLLQGLQDADITNIQYHVNTCFANYRKKERLELKRNNYIASSTTLLANTGSFHPSCSQT